MCSSAIAGAIVDNRTLALYSAAPDFGNPHLPCQQKTEFTQYGNLIKLVTTKMGATHGCRSQTYRAANTVLPAPPTRENALVSHRADSLRNLVGALDMAR